MVKGFLSTGERVDRDCMVGNREGSQWEMDGMTGYGIKHNYMQSS
jgi:hypothetical protein